MKSEELNLSDAISHLLDECRMVLPGIQALFGFQMVAVFDGEFKKLTHPEQELHSVAIVLVVFAIAILMAPASLHRQVEPRSASERFLNVASHLMLAAMVPLAMSISIDVYVVTQVIYQNPAIAAAMTAAALIAFITLWFLYPRVYRRGGK
ncbi:MAG TPA: DUF6328 family protein [Gemmatimonadaceae bacterium]|jgi:hypothetical protein|nr:DUF6328 family protein [Gemmatimonadaceae bacterium]